MHTVEVRYTPEIVRAGIRRFWWRFAGRDVLLGVVGVAALLFAWLGLGIDHWTVFALLGVCAFLALLSLAVFLSFRARSLQRLAEMGEPRAIWEFSEEHITSESSVARTRVQWAAVKKVWRFPDIWILFFSRYDISVLPIATLPAEVQDFICARIEANRGTID